MARVPSGVVAAVLRAVGGYDLPSAAGRAGVPVYAINGDLWPTDVEANRTIAPGFEVAIVPSAGHFPMLEQADVFNGLLIEFVRRSE
jgi:pimeloyl-ACP methyl ester carboxylesterase